MPTRVELIDPHTAPEDTLRGIHALWLMADEEEVPGEPPMPFEARVASMRSHADHTEVLQFAGWDGDDMVAIGYSWMDREQNPRNAFSWMFVHPDRRRNGHARDLATPLLDAVQERGRDRIAFEIPDGFPAGKVAERGGLKHVYGEQKSRLSVAEIDWALMDGWIDRAAERAPDYDLIPITHPIPEEMLDRYAEMYLIMNTAPREEMEEDDEVMTPEMLRDIDAKQIERSRSQYSLVAVHRPTEDWVGYTAINYWSLHPSVAYQWDTGVDPEHRNKGLGRWLKAEMIKTFTKRHPDVRFVDTWNAGSNEPMLNINIGMGFRPVFTANVWQGDLPTFRERLGV